MKKTRTKGFISGVLVIALLVGLVGTAAATAGQKTANLNYMDIKITLDGQAVTPTDANGNTVEPFAIDGTIYLPIRGIGNALGMGVNWDGKTSTAILTTNQSSEMSETDYVSLLGFYKILEESLTSINDGFNGIMTGSLMSYGNIKITEGPYKGKTMYAAKSAEVISDLQLVESHYAGCSGFLLTSDIELMTEYRRLANTAKSAYDTLGGSATQAQVNNVTGAAIQNSADSLLAKMKAEAAFWDAYQAAFS